MNVKETTLMFEGKPLKWYTFQWGSSLDGWFETEDQFIDSDVTDEMHSFAKSEMGDTVTFDGHGTWSVPNEF